MVKKAILGIIIAVIVIIGIFCLVVAMQPADFTITRSGTISASPERVFEQINDFHKWEAWSPWAKLDPAMKTTYTGPASGVGSTYSWIGNDDVGEGKMTVLESHPTDHIKIELEFIRPFAANNIIEFKLKTDGNKTDITWTMSGKNNFVSKAFNLVMNMDKLVGGDFENGLAQLKAVAEAEPRP